MSAEHSRHLDQQQLGTRSAPPIMLNQAIPSQFGCISSDQLSSVQFSAPDNFICFFGFFFSKFQIFFIFLKIFLKRLNRRHHRLSMSFDCHPGHFLFTQINLLTLSLHHTWWRLTTQ